VNCPKCKSRMAEVHKRGVSIDRCDSCNFLWFDPSEIYRYLRGPHNSPTFEIPDDSNFRLASSTRGQLCTRCDQNTFQSGAISGVPFLRCCECGGIGIWQQHIGAIRHAAIKKDLISPDSPPPSEPDVWDVWDAVGFVTAVLAGLPVDT